MPTEAPMPAENRVMIRERHRIPERHLAAVERVGLDRVHHVAAAQAPLAPGDEAIGEAAQDRHRHEADGIDAGGAAQMHA